MRITKRVTFDVDQYSLIQSCLAREIKFYEQINKSHDYDEWIQKIQGIIDLIDSAKSKVSYEE